MTMCVFFYKALESVTGLGDNAKQEPGCLGKNGLVGLRFNMLFVTIIIIHLYYHCQSGVATWALISIVLGLHGGKDNGP